MSIKVASYGGGVQSTALLVLAARGEIDYRTFLFANVGDDSEHPATLRYVREVALPYASEHGLELLELGATRRAQSMMTLYGRLTNPTSRSVGIPVRMSATGAPGRRACTTDFKIRRIARWLKRAGASETHPATVALGISLDEYHRAHTDSGIAWEVLTYPLLDQRLDRAACQALIGRAGLPIPPKSSCYFCPMHTLEHWRRQRDYEPELFAKSCALESLLNERRARLGKDPVWFTRKLIPLAEAIGDAIQTEMDFGGCESGYCFV